MLKMHNRSFKH